MSFIKELAGFLPTRSEQEIRDHEVWYQEYASLNEKKKEAIQKWREKKLVRIFMPHMSTPKYFVSLL